MLGKGGQGRKGPTCIIVPLQPSLYTPRDPSAGRMVMLPGRVNSAYYLDLHERFDEIRRQGCDSSALQPRVSRGIVNSIDLESTGSFSWKRGETSAP